MRIDLRTDPDAPLREATDVQDVTKDVAGIIAKVRSEGDAALIELAKEFDGATLTAVEVPREEMDQATVEADPDLLAALSEAATRIGTFASRQLIEGWRDEVGGGLIGETVHPVPRAGVYAPGGRASYPSTVLMGAVPAKVAGVDEIALCVPPGAEGKVSKSVLVAATVAGVDRVFAVGGAQAIAALAYGTETVPKVDVVVGPGNRFVAEAKRQVAGDVAIDSIAGPSEIAIIADQTSEPDLIAWDLIAQCEHGPGGATWLISWFDAVLDGSEAVLRNALDEIGASQTLRESLSRLKTVAVNDRAHALEVARKIAPEHLELLHADATDDVWEVKGAGAAFAGRWSPVPVGDYVAGTNHILPTGGTARWASGLRASLFQTTTSVVNYDRQALTDVLGHLDTLARTEGLEQHSQAAKARFAHDREQDD